jgi:hypothetical protein
MRRSDDRSAKLHSRTRDPGAIDAAMRGEHPMIVTDRHA